MEIKLSQLLESTILLEGRKEDTIKKYGEEHVELIDMLSSVDPSGNNKYLDWMVKTALGQNQDDPTPTADKIAKVVQDFHKQLARIKNKDINSYKKLIDLEEVVKEALAKEEEKKVAKQAKKIYEDDTAVVYAPFTVQASCKYGAGSKWCISGTGGPNNLNSYFDEYSKQANFYFFINKKMNTDTNPTDYKYALQWRFDGSGREMTWWDAKDDSHSEPPSWVTSEMMNAVEAFNPKHKKIKLGAQSKAFIENPTWREYNKFVDILTPEQKSSVINRIIERGDLDFKAFSVLSGDLTDEQKMNFITNYVKGQVSVSDYQTMKDNLNIPQKMTLVQFNPTILNNYDVMKELSDEFTDDQKYKLTKVINLQQINNTDSKVLLKQWSMTPEERKKHGQTSFYVFLSTPNEFIEKIVKVNPLDPESYRVINMMKLRKQVQSDVDLYGIKTESGLLDEYLGLTTSSIPNEILNLIKSKSNRL